ncbi:MAG: L,D-transpeptidase [bacterium]
MKQTKPILGALAMILLLFGLVWPFRPGLQQHPATALTEPSTDKPLVRIKPPSPREPYIVIDRYCNRLFLRTAKSVLLEARCSVGSGAELTDSVTGRHWRFDTPAGVFTIESKLEDPWWRKPDWAFIEEGAALPKSERDRLDSEMLGEYALGFGDGYFIHGTTYKRLLGVSVTHGCVRLDDEDLRRLYEQVRIGSRVYVY